MQYKCNSNAYSSNLRSKRIGVCLAIRCASCSETAVPKGFDILNEYICA